MQMWAGHSCPTRGTFRMTLSYLHPDAIVAVEIKRVRSHVMKIAKQRLPISALVLTASALWAASGDRYIHVRVSNPANNELVRVNVPLALAEKVIPAINHGELHDGKIQCGHFTADKVDVRAILDALKTAPEGEFVTVQEPDNNGRVAK